MSVRTGRAVGFQQTIRNERLATGEALSGTVPVEADDAMVDVGRGNPSPRRERVFGDPLERFDPTEIGPYRLLSRLGVGGMGTVYLSRTADGTPVAVKVIRPDLAANPEFRRRFRAEVEAARRVAPFCTAEVLDADPDAYQPYMVTEFIDGVRLDHEIGEHGPLSPSNLTGTAVGVATALTAIHRAGLVHRDLKPSNVILSLSGPRVIDFGISQALDGSVARPTQWGFGSAGWMAPEQVHGEPLGPPADVFVWGILMAYAGTGRHPYGEGTDVDLAYRIVNGEPNLDGLTAPMLDLVRSALAKRPDARPTARDLLLQLVERQPGNTSSGVLGTAEQALGLGLESVASRQAAAAYPPADRYQADDYRPHDYRPHDDRPHDDQPENDRLENHRLENDRGEPVPPAPPTRPHLPRRAVAIVLGVLLLLALVLAMVLTFPSGDAEADDPSATPSAPPGPNSPTPTPTTSPTTAANRDGQFAFTVTDVRCDLSQADGRLLPSLRGEFCVVDVEVENVGDSARWFYHGQQKLVDQNGVTYQADGFTEVDQLGLLGSGDRASRSLVFDVPEGTVPVEVELKDSDNDGGVTIPIG